MSVNPEPAASASDAPLVRAEGLVKRFPGRRNLLGVPTRWVHAVREVSFAISRGQTLGLVGESGCGKSTVGRLLLGLLPPTHGRVFLGDVELTALSPEPLRRLRRRMQLIFQDPFGALNPKMRIGEAIGEPLEIHAPEVGAKERRARVEALLDRVGMRTEHALRRPAEFSGGQRQRIVIARALSIEPELIVADEPVSALDVSVQAQILNLMNDLQAERGLTYLFISHDLRVVEHMSQQVAVMYLGRIVEQAPTAALFERPLHPYTEALLSAAPDPRPDRPPRVVLEGDVPSPLDPPPGCAFHPRCPLYRSLPEDRRERCRSELPALRRLEVGQVACHFAGE